ncbi:uncharacterized protein At5g39865-like [Momordica charantia]|uniref:Uncharacterized protein At5g39865-like n=1 Tax=Momordica charantia TaxID=3673 RepID=A0A6J1DZ40_MOMCH|nr:uncharacterized protein At5g39865-like [Momordica charantia]
MGCVSSHLLNHDDEFAQLGSSALSHHIVSLTSTTYGLLNLDPPPIPIQSPAAPRFTFGSVFSSPLCEPKSACPEPEVINSWELMDGLDADSFRFSLLPQSKRFALKDPHSNNENSNPNCPNHILESTILGPSSRAAATAPATIPSPAKHLLDRFERLCPPSGENRVVVYTTTLRGIRKTFEECNAVRAAIEGTGVQICERDVSMDRGFREELKELMKGRGPEAMVPPRVFIRGRYIGNGEQVLKMVEEGAVGELLQGLPKIRGGSVCEGCGNARFLPCFRCSGSCKLVMPMKQQGKRAVVIKCPDCNENGLVLCPICS